MRWTPTLLGLLATIALGCAAESGVTVEEFAGDCRTAHDGAALFAPAAAVPMEYVPGAVDGDHWGGFFGGGLAVADFDGDARPDLYLANRGVSPSLFLNAGGFGFDEVPGAGGADPGPFTNGASAADIDSDGDVDLVVMSDGLDRVYRNEGDGTFTEITAEAGFDVPERTLAVAWADVNGDRWLDPFFCGFFGAWEGADGDPAPDRFYLSDGAGGWDDATDLFPTADEPSGCFGARFVDLDGDDQLDLLVTNDKGNFFTPDQAWMGSEDGSFTEEANDRGLGQGHSGMGVAVGDFDGDGDPDVWKSGTPDWLLVNDGGRFVDVSATSGVRAGSGRSGSSWDVDTWDFDGDGDLDVLSLVSGYGVGAEAADGDQVWINRGDATFELQPGSALGLAVPSVTRSMGRADLDGDGAPDLVLPEIGERVATYQGRCTGGHFVEVRVHGTHCAADAPGATVRIEAGGQRWEEQVTVGGQVQSSQPPWLHFGLGDADTVDRVEVVFPCGAVQSAEDLPADTRLSVVESTDPGAG